MNERLQPAFWGGLFIGVLSALPIVGAANCCCCLWVVLGGALATYLRQQNTPFSVDASEGALVGVTAGAIGGIIWAVLSIPMMMVAGPLQQQLLDRMLENPEVPAELRDLMAQAAVGTAWQAVAMLVNFMFSLVFGLLGGLLGVALFRKSAPPPPPPGTIDVLPPEPPRF